MKVTIYWVTNDGRPSAAYARNAEASEETLAQFKKGEPEYPVVRKYEKKY